MAQSRLSLYPKEGYDLEAAARARVLGCKVQLQTPPEKDFPVEEQ